MSENRLPRGVLRDVLMEVDPVTEQEKKVYNREYYRNGLIKRETRYHRDGDMAWNIVYQYSLEGKIRKKTAFREEEVLWEITYSYDTEKRRAQEVRRNKAGAIDKTLVYNYDKDRTEVLSYNQTGSLQWRKKILFHEKQNLEELQLFYPDGNRIKAILKKKNAAGQTIEEKHIDEIGGTYRKILTEYDVWGRKTKQTFINYRGIVYRQVWMEYNDSGQVSRIRQIQPEEKRVVLHEYTYRLTSGNIWTNRKTTISIQEDAMEQPFIYTREERRVVDFFLDGE